jgi:hypothetical protein
MAKIFGTSKITFYLWSVCLSIKTVFLPSEMKRHVTLHFFFRKIFRKTFEMQEEQTKPTPPSWFSDIDFGKVERFLKSEEGEKVVHETMTISSPAEQAITEMPLVTSQKIKEPYTI